MMEKKCTTVLHIIIKGGNSICCLRVNFNKQWNTIIVVTKNCFVFYGKLYFVFMNRNVHCNGAYVFAHFASNNFSKSHANKTSPLFWKASSMATYMYYSNLYEGSAAAIWSLADIAYIAIYRDMNKISRYCIAIFFKYISVSSNY